MIFHINRATYKSDLSEEQRREGVEMLRQSGANPAVTSYVVGPELGGEYEYGAAYVLEDLDSYWAYLEFPAHVHLELWGIPYLEKFAAIDICDSDDPGARREDRRAAGPPPAGAPRDRGADRPGGLVHGARRRRPAIRSRLTQGGDPDHVAPQR